MEDKKSGWNQDSDQSNSDSHGSVSLLCYLISIGMLIYAFILGYQEPGYSNKIVGGDAYNYLIYTNRAIIFALAGVAFAAMGLGCQVAKVCNKL
ncbi:hypothetical protein LG272_10995 [Pseudidiomarina marina]|uniref:hypothetical protein n=1 Tax=Pseudidiomarina marina TaxID=502366 RepID=UPI00384A8755